MALKGQKFIRFTDEERTEIVGKYLSGKYSYATFVNVKLFCRFLVKINVGFW